mgnify:CR=1 FL=1
MDSYLNNLLAMPVILSLWQFEKIWLFRKGPAFQLSALEIAVATLYVSLVSEVIFPLISKDFYADGVDVLVYIIGSIIFYGVNKYSHRKLSSRR